MVLKGIGAAFVLAILLLTAPWLVPWLCLGGFLFVFARAPGRTLHVVGLVVVLVVELSVVLGLAAWLVHFLWTDFPWSRASMLACAAIMVTPLLACLFDGYDTQ